MKRIVAIAVVALLAISAMVTGHGFGTAHLGGDHAAHSAQPASAHHAAEPVEGTQQPVERDTRHMSCAISGHLCSGFFVRDVAVRLSAKNPERFRFALMHELAVGLYPEATIPPPRV